MKTSRDAAGSNNTNTGGGGCKFHQIRDLEPVTEKHYTHFYLLANVSVKMKTAIRHRPMDAQHTDTLMHTQLCTHTEIIQTLLMSSKGCPFVNEAQ